MTSAPAAHPTTVLFLSTGNAVRGILAEALLRHKGGARFAAISAGYSMRPAIEPQALAMLRAEGISTDGLHTKGWQEIFRAPQSILVDVIVTLSEEARAHCPKWPGDPVRVHWPVDDPLAAPTPDAREWKFRKCFATLQNRVDALIKQRAPHSAVELKLQLMGIAAVV
ncbi:MAG: arsenate reductase ArsC [Alphaproteobacteria bacterium]|nr:arsenate reductase ArsC [Alphaproteobacteria bacterium]